MLTVTDLFAGAGGSSTGAIQAPGVEIRIAANHWQKALDVHNANHPDAEHVRADITIADPRRFPRTDLLWASPECTNHSQAKGRRRPTGQPDLFGETIPNEAEERSRATMWDVVRFSEVHRYQAVVVENVVEAAKWLPFDAWLMAMHALGYDHHIIYLNSMHAQAAGLPAPQSRDRMYVVFWRRGNRRPDFERWQTPKAWCTHCEKIVDARQVWKKPEAPWGRYRSQYVYVCPDSRCRRVVEPGWLPAATAIDWAIPGQRIGDRDRPLKPKTRARIAAGIARYWRPIHLENAGNTFDSADPRHPRHGDPNGYMRAWPADDVLRTIHTWGDARALACPPFVMDTTRSYDGHQARRQWPADQPLPTQTAQHSNALVQPAFVTLLRSDRARNTDPAVDPLATLVADGSNHALVQPPFVAELRGGGSDARSLMEALATIVASGNHHALIAPYYSNGDARPASSPLGTVTTVDRHALIVRNNDTRGGGNMAWASTPVTEVLRTLAASPTTQALLTPGDIEAAEAQVDDCLFRMFEPHEIARGMAFPWDYIWDGTKREIVRMAGGAVTPPSSRDIVGCVVESLTGEVMAHAA